MKRASYPAAFVFLAFVMTFSLLSCGGGDDGGTPEVVRYVVTDLQGTWYLGRVNTNDTGAAGNSYYGQMDLTSAGYVLQSSFYYLWAENYLSFTGGSLALAQDTGVLSGTINTGAGSFKLDSGKMDPSKSAMVFTNYNSLLDNQFDLTIAIKRGGSYVGSDVEGTWYLFGLCSNPAGIGIVRGDMVVGKFGAITGNYIFGGPFGTRVYTIDSGTLSISTGDTPGTLLGNFVTNDDTGRTIENGMMDISKTFASLVIVSTVDPTISESEMVVMIKQASNLLTADLAGTWYISGASAGNAVSANDGTIKGNVTLNAAGAITGGSITLPGLTALSITGGNMTLTAAGVEGTMTTVDGNIYFMNGRLDASKNKMAFTDLSEKRLFILFSVK